MIRVLLTSDTHGNPRSLIAAKDEIGKVDAIFHTGDFGPDAGDLGLAFAAPVYAVRGNCDDRYLLKDMPDERIVTIGGLRFLLTHGHRERSNYTLLLKAEEKNCKAVFFGHTHCQFMTSENGILLVNPGSPSLPRDGAPGYGILEIDNGDYTVSLKRLSDVVP